MGQGGHLAWKHGLHGGVLRAGVAVYPDLHLGLHSVSNYNGCVSLLHISNNGKMTHFVATPFGKPLFLSRRLLTASCVPFVKLARPPQQPVGVRH